MPGDNDASRSVMVEAMNPQDTRATLLVSTRAANHIPTRLDGLSPGAAAVRSHAARQRIADDRHLLLIPILSGLGLATPGGADA